MKKNCIHYVTALFLITFIGVTDEINAQQTVQGNKLYPVKTAVVNFRDLSEKEAILPRDWLLAAPVPNNVKQFKEPFYPNTPANLNTPVPFNTPNTPSVVSPSPLLNFEGAPDEAQGGGASGSYNIPPDTYGAVGLDKVFTTLNNNYRILDKATGAQLSLVSMPSFWSALGADGAGAFDPRVVYDPYNNRWIHAAVTNAGVATSRILLAISQTSDPQGSYTLFAFDPDTGTTLWADFPMLGFNKNWVDINVNMFTVVGSTFSEGRALVVDYPTLLTGSASASLFTGITSGLGGFCPHPAETYSSTEAILYIVSHLSSGGATYKLSTLTGTPAAPVYTVGATNTRTGGGWSPTGGNIMPQQCLASCPGTLVKVDPGDQFNRCNVVFRNGFVWYAQTIGLPSGGAPTHTAVQWTKLTASTALFADGGRIEDATATDINGGKWYGHPSISVNKNDDVLIGFTEGESDDFLDAAYAFRLGTDPAGTMQDVVVFKDGLDYYEKDFGSGRQRWGDYSHTQVDPYDDVSFWTIQQYSKLRAAPTVGGSNSKWGTWWAQVMPNQCNSAVASGNWNVAGTWGCGRVPTASDNVVIVSGQNVTLNVDPIAASITVNSGGTLTISSTRTLSCNLLVNGTLNITGGKLILGSNHVNIERLATLTGASTTSYFVTNGTGEVKKSIAASSNFTFPVSSNTTSYTPLTIALNAGDPTELFCVRVSTGITPAIVGSAYAVQRTWNVYETTAGGNNAILTFQWTAPEQGSSYNPLKANTTSRNDGSFWILASSMPVPSFVSGIYTCATSTAISSFGPLAVSSNGVLPVIIEYFTGKKQATTNLLNWKASCNSAQATFSIERSNDGRNFAGINTITANYIRCLQPFDYTDLQPLSGINYYRIKMTDAEGKDTYSSIIALLNDRKGFEIINLSPSLVVDGKSNLNLSSAQAQTVNIVVTGSMGNILNQFSQTLIAGSNQIPMDFSALAAGSYFVSVITAEREKKSVRFVKY